jgi:hypothetical protein
MEVCTDDGTSLSLLCRNHCSRRVLAPPPLCQGAKELAVTADARNCDAQVARARPGRASAVAAHHLDVWAELPLVAAAGGPLGRGGGRQAGVAAAAQ